MKIQKAINIIKKSPSITLWRDEATGTQMITDGYAVYDVSCWPYIEKEEELAAILGIDDMKKHTFVIGEMPDAIKPGEAALYADRIYVTLEFGDRYTFFDVGGKIIAVKEKFLSPFGEDAVYKYRKSGESGLVEIGGLIAEGFIAPCVIGDTLKREIERVFRGL